MIKYTIQNLQLISTKYNEMKNTMKYNNQIIQTRFNHGEPMKFLFFWGYQPNKDGSERSITSRKTS